MTLFSEEIRLGLKKGYHYIMLSGFWFDRAPLLKDFMEDGFKNKAQAAKECDEVMT
jgi:hypothetical protein